MADESGPTDRSPEPWTDDEDGAFVIQLTADGQPTGSPLTFCRRGKDAGSTSDWTIYEFMRVRGVTAEIFGWIAGDGAFDFYNLNVRSAECASEEVLTAFVEASDPRLHRADRGSEWEFDS
jgi:hypothetical protein